MEPNAESIWIIGYGQFGRRAAYLLLGSSGPRPHVTAIDSEPKEKISEGVDYIQADGIQWFVDRFQLGSNVDRIIPALPIHLAAEWIKKRLATEKRTVRTLSVPPEILPHLPNPFRLGDDCYAISHADFLCPPDCNEPEGYCTVTGQPRPTPLYELVGALSLNEFVILTITSRQFAPGVGGFYPADLWRLFDEVCGYGDRSFLLCTACKCHGVITGFHVAT